VTHVDPIVRPYDAGIRYCRGSEERRRCQKQWPPAQIRVMRRRSSRFLGQSKWRA